jgi:hypothetical protein
LASHFGTSLLAGGERWAEWTAIKAIYAREREGLTAVAEPDKLKVGRGQDCRLAVWRAVWDVLTAIKSSGVTVLISLLGGFRVVAASSRRCR